MALSPTQTPHQPHSFRNQQRLDRPFHPGKKPTSTTPTTTPTEPSSRPPRVIAISQRTMMSVFRLCSTARQMKEGQQQLAGMQTRSARRRLRAQLVKRGISTCMISASQGMIRFRQRRISRIYGNDAVRRAMGVRVRYQQCSMDVAMQFRLAGDSKHLLLSFIAKELIDLIDLRCPLLPPNPLLPPPIQPYIPHHPLGRRRGLDLQLEGQRSRCRAIR